MTGTAPVTVALTGATGFAGGALARTLVHRGYRVRALTRRPTSAYQDLVGVEWIHGEITDPAALDTLVAGADTCFHVAAKYRIEGSAAEFLQINRDSTALLLQSAKAAGVRRFIYCSTIGVHGDLAETPGDENAPFNPRDPYQQSKVLAEELCRKAIADRGNPEIVIVRPCGIYGPGDMRMLKMFTMLQHGRFVFIGPAQSHFHPVYIDDLVEGLILAMTRAEARSQTFILGAAEHLPLRDYVAKAARVLGVRMKIHTIPYGLAKVAAFACELACAPFRIPPPLHRRRLTFFKHNRAFKIDKARRLLGYEPRVGLEEGFRRTVAWYRREGLLR
jgi:nucleoside-diphosphate-sugar epimerase